MQRRPLGRTGLTVTPLGLGLAALGRPGYINLGHADDLERTYDVGAMAARAHRVLDAAHATGIGYFDAARSYGRAEEFLGAWLHERGLTPGSVTVGSKWGYTYTADWQVDAERHEVKDHTLATLRRQLPESLELLGDHLGLYQVHSATLESGILDDGAVLDELAGLRDRGIAVGLSTSGPAQGDVIRRALSVDRGGDPLFATVQSTWNVLEPSAGPALAEAHQAGVGVIVKEALANGRLTHRNAALDPAVRAALDPDATSGHPLDVLALAEALRRPWATVVLSGAATVDQLSSHLDAVAVAATTRPAPPEVLAAVAERPDDYWRSRTAMPWN